MLNALPKVIPINELKNTAQITKTCKESDVPIIVTKNGYGEMVMMSVKLYEETFAKIQVASLLNSALEDIEKGVPLVDGEKYFADLLKKYGE